MSTSDPEKPKRVRAPKKKATGVPGTYRGFSLQHNRFVHHLLSCDLEDTVCLEAFDDVGVEKADGSKVAEQNKSFKSSNALANRSLQFWKTLANWLDACRDGELDPSRTKFILYATSFEPGDIASAFNKAADAHSASAAISKAKLSLNYPDGLSDDPEVKEYMLAVLDDKTTNIHAILASFSIYEGSLTGCEELVTRFANQLISDDNRNDVIAWAQGWVKTQLDAQLATGKPCRIKKKDFHTVLCNYVQTHDRKEVLKSVAANPDDTRIQADLEYKRYVRQLILIEHDEESMLEAINDFVRAAIDRSHWSENGFITEAALESYSNEFIKTWKNKKTRVKIEHSAKSPIDLGKLIFLDCIEHSAKIDGLESPPHFARGSWHSLSDGKDVGWHPDFEKLIE